MSTYMDSNAASAPPAPVSRRQARRARKEREERDLELVAGVARGEVEALTALAERLAPRIDRIARALMGGAAQDADDAAAHALIEVLRSHASYRGKEPLERWGDRSAALSVVRFARAVSRRSETALKDQVEAIGPARPRIDERNARTFAEYLFAISETARQTLLLRHALGFKLTELSDALQCSAASARQQLLDARAELRGLIRRRQGAPAPLGAGALRWCEQRDREAIGETLRSDELEELAQLEARDSEVWAFVAQVRALETYFESARGAELVAEATWVARAVAALRVSSPLQTLPQASGTLESHQIRDLEGSRAVRYLAFGASAGLAGATVLALLWHRPGGEADAAPKNITPARPAVVRSDSGTSAQPARARLSPTVEALPKVTTSETGGRLFREGRPLAPGALISQGDLVDTNDRPACLRIEPDSDVCLAVASSVRLVSISARARQLELLRGRAVVRVGQQSQGTEITLAVGALSLRAGRAVVGVERAPDGKQVRIRALRGSVEVTDPRESRTLDEASALTFYAPGAVSVAALTAGFSQRDWDVLAHGLHPPALVQPRLPARPGAAEPPLELPAAGGEPEASAEQPIANPHTSATSSGEAPP